VRAALTWARRGRPLNEHRARVRSPVFPRRASITIASKRVEETAAWLITPIIDSADLHRGVVPRRRFFSAACDSADSWKQPGELATEHGWAEGGATGGYSAAEINPSETTRPLCLGGCHVIPAGYRTNGLFQVISRGVAPVASAVPLRARARAHAKAAAPVGASSRSGRPISSRHSARALARALTHSRAYARTRGGENVESFSSFPSSFLPICPAGCWADTFLISRPDTLPTTYLVRVLRARRVNSRTPCNEGRGRGRI